MTTKRVTAALVMAMFLAFAGARPAAAAAGETAAAVKAAEKAAKVKSEIGRLGTGEAARVDVRLRDARRVRGYVSAASEAAFEVKDLETGATTSVAYDDVSKVKGHNLSTGTWIAIGTAAAVGVVLLIVLATYLGNES